MTIRELAEQVCAALSFKGEPSTPQSLTERRKKLLDVTRMHQLGWQPKTSLVEGIALTYEAARPQLEALTAR